MDSLLDIKQTEELTSLPNLSVHKDLTQKADHLLVILRESDLSQPIPFLKVLETTPNIKEELKKKKKLTFYGTQDDLYGVCYVRLASFESDQDTLNAAAEQTRIILGDKVISLSVFFPESLSSEQITSFLTGILLTNYKHIKHSYIGVDESAKFKRIGAINIINKNFDLKDEKSNFAIQSTQYSLFCRQILNLRPLEGNPETFLAFCKNLAKIDPKVSIETIVDKELTSKGLNCIYSVGRGASSRPCLVILKYEGNPQKPDDVIALVGKGVCFDAGGLNIKPTGAIEDMWSDKGGACAVLSTFKAAVEMKLAVNLVVATPFVENLLGSDAFHPSDIIKSLKGLTIEITNTDAEGRLILCDAMTYTQLHYKPNTLIELSTLTGAIIIALGATTAGLFSNSDELANELLKASGDANERLWRLPIFEEHRNLMKGTFSDLKNTAAQRVGGASCAAAFLEKFVEKEVNWAHLDIAGTAIVHGEKSVYNEGATGFGVRLLLNYLRSRQAK